MIAVSAAPVALAARLPVESAPAFQKVELVAHGALAHFRVERQLGLARKATAVLIGVIRKHHQDVLRRSASHPLARRPIERLPTHSAAPLPAEKFALRDLFRLPVLSRFPAFRAKSGPKSSQICKLLPMMRRFSRVRM